MIVLASLLLGIFLMGCQKWQPTTQGELSSPSVLEEQPKGEPSSPSPEQPKGEPSPPSVPYKELEFVSFPKGQVTDGCLEGSVSEHHACIFQKNPVADVGRELEASEAPSLNLVDTVVGGQQVPPITVDNDVSSMQKYMVSFPENLEGLENEDFVIESVFSDYDPPSRLVNGDWRYSFQENPESLTAIHTFYWINHLAEKIKLITGSFYPAGQGISVIAFTPYISVLGGALTMPAVGQAFWAAANKLLLFGVSVDLYMPLGLDSGIIAHELGHAILDYASNANLHIVSDEQKTCSLGSNERSICSKTEFGSVFSIHEGVADVVSIFLFPESTPLGEMMFNSPDGMEHCQGVSRDVKKIKENNLNSSHFWDCLPRGEIHTMGSIYSTIWYGVFQRALTRGGMAERDDAYRLFFEHLKNVTYQDTFLTLRDVVKVLDRQEFEGRFSEDLDAEYKLIYPNL